MDGQIQEIENGNCDVMYYHYFELSCIGYGLKLIINRGI